MRRLADSVIGKQCPICLNGVDIRSAAVIIPCMHAYCIQCIRRWSDIKRNCPLCNADFCSWFVGISKGFREEKLLPFGRGKKVDSVRREEESALLRRRRAQFFEERRIVRRCRGTSVVQSQARVLPRRRSFRHSSHEGPDVVAERIRQWRASIYEQRMQAVPPPSKNGLIQQMSGNNVAKEMVLRRIEPWIRRELEAILRDPDPTIIVHVASSLFISVHEKQNVNVQDQDDFLAPLRPFLHEQTETFWHELRCFAENSLSMETYDTVVVYTEVDQ